VSDQPFYAPDRKAPAPRQPQPGELLEEFLVGHARWRIELRDHGTFGVEAQLLKNEEFFASRTFSTRDDPTRRPRELAIAWAKEERKALEHP
jgi:hypothetical protein